MTFTALLVSTLSLAQQMPYNPDANGDDFVGVDDVLGVLGVYDTALMQPDLTCDYEGTDLEQLFSGILTGSLVLDSVYVEYLLVDTVQSYSPGCPDPIDEEVVLQRSYTFPITAWDGYVNSSLSYLDFPRYFYLGYDYDDGSYLLFISDDEVHELTSFDKRSDLDNMHLVLPFPESFGLSEDGLLLVWEPYDWVGQCESFRLIPFWHEAE